MTRKRLVGLLALLIFVILAASGLNHVYVEMFGRPVDNWLSQAAYQGDVRGVVKALAAGADVNTTVDDDSPTPLIMAALGSHLEVAKVLIAHGADVNKESAEEAGKTPLNMTSDSALLRYLVAHGANVNTQSNAGTGWTALMSASQAGRYSDVQLLLSKGADVRAKNWEGDTALTLARKNGYPKIVQLLKRSASSRPSTNDRRRQENSGPMKKTRPWREARPES